MQRARHAHAADRRRQIEEDLAAFRRKGGEVKAIEPGERAGLTGHKHNTHLFTPKG